MTSPGARFNLVPDPRFEPQREGLRERIQTAANALRADTFADVLDSTMRGIVDAGFRAAGAHEGTVWLAERSGPLTSDVEALVPVYNTGPEADRFVGTFRQPLNRGLISAVFAYEQPFCENDVYKNQKQDRTLDQTLGVLTASMIAVPLYFAGELRGIVSCVQLKRPGDPVDPPGFTMESLRHIQLASEVLTRLLDHWLIERTFGLGRR